MADIAKQKSSLSGLVLTFAAATAGGDSFTNDGNVALVVTNAHASAARTVTVVSDLTVDGLAVTDNAVVVAAQTTAYIGIFNTSTFGATSPTVQVTYSDSGADLTVALLQVR